VNSGKLAVLNLLSEIEGHLAPLVGARGFTLTDTSAAVQSSETSVQLISFRAGVPGQRIVLLDLCQILDQQTVAVELWSPDDLRKMASTETDHVAIHRRVWHYGASGDDRQVVLAIVRAVACWIETYDAERHLS
jgi:hypothetical protein